MVKHNRERVGLCLYDTCAKKIIVLQRMRPYDRKHEEMNTNLNFVEKFQIPRGALKSGENPLCGAIREFVEETSLVPMGDCFVSEDSIQLEWWDSGKLWQYQIFVMKVKNIMRVTGCQTIKLTDLNKQTEMDIFVRISLFDETMYTVRHFSIKTYQNIMKVQSKLYENSNYEWFLEELSKKIEQIVEMVEEDCVDVSKQYYNIRI